MTRDERQKECVKKWIQHKCRATIVAATGFGKTRTSFLAISTILAKFPETQINIIVPTTALKDQWNKQIDERGLGLNAHVYVVNSAIKSDMRCDMLIIDEVHRFASDTFITIFQKCRYKFVLGLTATYERLDGKEHLLEHYCPKCDEVSLLECAINNWISKYQEYLVLIQVDDIDTYMDANREFHSHFEYFGFNWDLINKLTGSNGYLARIQYRDSICAPNANSAYKSAKLKEITYHVTAFMRCMQKRKLFINNHPKKIEIVKKILEARNNKKTIVFSGNVKMAESLGIEHVFTGRTGKKRSKTMIEEFNAGQFNQLSTVKKANEGLDVKGLEVGIVIGTDSSRTSAQQRLGRVIRAEQFDKNAEFFNIIIHDTVEESWFRKSHEGANYTTIDEDGLYKLLNGEVPDSPKIRLQNYMFRF